MRTIKSRFTRRLRNRLKVTVMGLGLARVLQDAGRPQEARAALEALENSLQGVVRCRCEARGEQGVIGIASCSSGSMVPEMQPSIA